MIGFYDKSNGIESVLLFDVSVGINYGILNEQNKTLNIQYEI